MLGCPWLLFWELRLMLRIFSIAPFILRVCEAGKPFADRNAEHGCVWCKSGVRRGHLGWFCSHQGLWLGQGIKQVFTVILLSNEIDYVWHLNIVQESKHQSAIWMQLLRMTQQISLMPMPVGSFKEWGRREGRGREIGAWERLAGCCRSGSRRSTMTLDYMDLQGHLQCWWGGVRGHCGEQECGQQVCHCPLPRL